MMVGFVIWGVLFAAPFVAWLLFRSGGYKRQPLDAPPVGDWVFTGERFVDPSSGVALEVGTTLATASASMCARASAKARRLDRAGSEF